MTDLLLWEEQRRLRQALFEGPQALRWRPARELAAQLLLYLDDPLACWRLSAEWLREQLQADRVDVGSGGYVCDAGGRRDYVVLAESRREGSAMVSMLGQRFAAGAAGLREVWQCRGGMAVPRLAQAGAMAPALRERLQQSGAAAKIALALRAGQPLGMMCADWQREAPHWPAEVCRELPALGRRVIGPLIELATSAAGEPSAAGLGPALHRIARRTEGGAGSGLRALLSPAERRVAELVAQGLSYKEVARQLGRSLSTVDHQLRSIRAKAGVASTARLVRLLNA